jgi:murein L,D-transpeptidase YafK
MFLSTRCVIVLIGIVITTPIFAQRRKQKQDRIHTLFEKQETRLKIEFIADGLHWSTFQMHIRSFKQEAQLEVWVRNNSKDPFQLFKTYKVCALSGTLGPKRKEGDYQVPEGFYFINEFRPNSNYHLALGLNYPNAADKKWSDSLHPGNEIYIHGGCITVGCIPIQNHQIEELYVLARTAFKNKQAFIPVHIFPMRYNGEKADKTIRKFAEYTPGYDKLSASLKSVYNHFETTKRLPLIGVDADGKYVVFR